MRMEKKYVRRRRILAAILVIGFFWLLLDWTTPKPCKVKVENMSSWCKDLMYP